MVRIPAGARNPPSSTSLETFDPPAVKDVKIERFGDDGLGDEPHNRTAINSLKAYRALRYGRHLDLWGAEQKAWFKELSTSTATWKVWGNSLGALDRRADPQNLPAGLTVPLP